MMKEEKKTVFHLFKELKNNYQFKVIARNSFSSDEISVVKTNALFFSREVQQTIKDFKPDVLIYFPFASATFASYLRLKLLSNFSAKAKPIFISLQPKTLKKWQKQIVKVIKPKYALTPSPQLKAFWDKINVKNELLPLLTDINVFNPLKSENKKLELRNKYNLPEDAIII